MRRVHSKMTTLATVLCVLVALHAFPALAQTQTDASNDQASSTTTKKKKSKKSKKDQSAGSQASASGGSASNSAVSTSTSGNNASSSEMSKKSSSKSAASGASASDIAAAKSSGKVWVNLDSGIYHKSGRWYGKTKNGKFMTEQEAKAAGYKVAQKE